MTVVRGRDPGVGRRGGAAAPQGRRGRNAGPGPEICGPDIGPELCAGIEPEIRLGAGGRGAPGTGPS